MAGGVLDIVIPPPVTISALLKTQPKLPDKLRLRFSVSIEEGRDKLSRGILFPLLYSTPFNPFNSISFYLYPFVFYLLIFYI
jgi:hypothetical protein